MPKALPFIKAAGSSGEIGLTIGRALRPLINAHLDAWLDHVIRETSCTRREAVESARIFDDPIRTYAPFLWEELKGLASGAELSTDELLVLQARNEVLKMHAKTQTAPGQECTTFAVGGSRTIHGHVFFGHNVDLPPLLEPYGVIVQREPSDAPRTLIYSAAGLLGHNGLNECGVGICANYIDDPDGWGPGFPRYLLSRLALQAKSTRDALDAVLKPPRAASRNLLIADAEGDLVDAELLTRTVGLLEKQDDLLVHANHLETPELAGLDAPEEDSLHRRRRMQHLFDESSLVSLEDLKRFLADHDGGINSICVHPRPDSNWKTIVSVIGDLTERAMHVARGTPCDATYETYTFD